MRSLLALLAVVLLSVAATACGGTGRVASSTAHASSSVAVAAGSVAETIPALPPPEPATARYLNDGDHDHIGDPDTDNKNDNDEDPYYDYKPDDNGRYHDSDDARVLAYSHAASPADERAVSAVAKRYYAAAAAGDGSRACSTIVPSFVRAIPEDYGRFGPSYLRGGKTCRAVMVRLFRHSHGELSAPVAVTGVRVEGDHAYALLGSTRMPASYVTLQREHGVWTIDELLGGPLP